MFKTARSAVIATLFHLFLLNTGSSYAAAYSYAFPPVCPTGKVPMYANPNANPLLYTYSNIDDAMAAGAHPARCRIEPQAGDPTCSTPPGSTSGMCGRYNVLAPGSGPGGCGPGGYAFHVSVPFQCAVPPQNNCSNPSKNAKAIHVDASSLAAQTDYCLNGCVLRVAKGATNVHLPGSATDRRTAWGTFVGQECSVGNPQPQEAAEKKNSDGTDGACTADKTACISREKKNCGYVNGESRCVTANQLTPDNPCAQTGSGAVFCRADALTPPKPDNGTPGQPATPDNKFEVQDPTLIGSPGGSTIGMHYYKPSTVNGSSNSPGNDSNNNGRCEEGEAGSKDCTPLEGGGDCEEGEECGNGASFIAPAGEYGYDDLNGDVQEARANLNQALIDIRTEALQIFGNGPTGGGSLPCPSADILGATVSICLSDYEDQLNVIGAMIMLGAVILSALVILGGKS